LKKERKEKKRISFSKDVDDVLISPVWKNVIHKIQIIIFF